MQYLLTQQEYDALTPVKRVQERNEALEVARQIIVKLSNQPCGEGYCDQCPVSSIGGEIGENDRPSHEISRLICIKNKRYGK